MDEQTSSNTLLVKNSIIEAQIRRANLTPNERKIRREILRYRLGKLKLSGLMLPRRSRRA